MSLDQLVDDLRDDEGEAPERAERHDARGSLELVDLGDRRLLWVRAFAVLDAEVGEDEREEAVLLHVVLRKLLRRADRVGADFGEVLKLLAEGSGRRGDVRRDRLLELGVADAEVAAAGVVLLMQGRGDLNLVGFLFALAAGTCWGLYILVGAALGRHTTEGNGLALGMAVASLVAVPFGVAEAGTALVQPWVLVAGLGVALLSTVIPYSLELEALRKIPPRVFGILMSLEPAAAAAAGWVLLSQALGPRELTALVLVSAASLGVTLGRRPDAMPLQPLE